MDAEVPAIAHVAILRQLAVNAARAFDAAFRPPFVQANRQHGLCGARDRQQRGIRAAHDAAIRAPADFTAMWANRGAATDSAAGATFVVFAESGTLALSALRAHLPVSARLRPTAVDTVRAPAVRAEGHATLWRRHGVDDQCGGGAPSDE